MPGQALRGYLKPTRGNGWICHPCLPGYVPQKSWSGRQDDLR
jgi:hypothetical protein